MSTEQSTKRARYVHKYSSETPETLHYPYNAVAELDKRVAQDFGSTRQLSGARQQLSGARQQITY